MANSYLDRQLLTMWCVAHRSALAMGSFVVTVPELKIWLSNIKNTSPSVSKAKEIASFADGRP